MHFEEPCVTAGNSVERAVTYFRNVIPGYNQTVDVFIDVDTVSNGWPDYVLDADLDLDPALRWNCSEFGGLCTPDDATALIVRTQHDGDMAPNVATDGPFINACAPLGAGKSFYYGVNATWCQQWIGPSGRRDSFLYWLIVDTGCGPPTRTESTTWGKVKAIYE